MGTVLLVEDHPLYATALQSVLRAQYPSLVVHTACSCGQAEQWLRESASARELRALLCDLNLPDAAGLGVVERLRPLTPATMVIVTAESSERWRAQAEQLGVDRVVSKSASASELAEHLAQVLGPSTPPGSAPPRALDSLSSSQRKVAEQLLLGQSNKEIARTLNLGLETVKSHVAEIIARLEARNRTEAVLKLLQDQRQ